MDEVERLSDGRITFERFWGGALAGVLETSDIVKDRVADLGCTQFGAHPAKFPMYGFPYTFAFSSADPSVGTKAMWTIQDEYPVFIDEPAAAQNQKLIMFLSTDSYDLISTKPMVTLDDFKGTVIGLWGIYMPKWVEVLGASGTPTPATDRYMLLKDGVMDASLLLTTAKVDMKHYEIAKHLTILNLGCYVADNMAINLDTFNELPPDLQKLMLDVGRETSTGWHTIRTRYRAAAAVAELEKQGCTIHRMSEEDKTKWLGMMDDYPAEWAEEMEALGLPGFAVAKTWVKVHKEYFHEWPREWAVRK